MGDAVNLAARLMAKAPPGEIYATAGVLDRSATRFALAELQPFTVKGKTHPIQAWSVGPPLGRRAREGVAVRFPLVGRERELGVLEEALAAARSGRGWLVDIAGEPGIGKTRLMEELRGRAPDLRRLHATCEPYAASTPYAVWRDLLRPLVGIGSEDPEDVAQERLRSYVERLDPELAAWLPLLGIPLGLSLAPTREVEELAEDFRGAKLHEVVLRFLSAALPAATLIEIDDAHLMDAASADLLQAMTGALERAPWLVVVTRRDGGSGFAPPDSPAVLRVWPSPLGRRETVALAEAVTDDAPLAPHVLELAGERSAGNPQFLRDLLREAAIDGGASLPESIEAAAMARIDRLQPGDRAIVRRAAVLGLSFASRFLEDVLAGDVAPPDEQAWRRLDGLFAAEGEGHVRFRRAVMREAAYAGLPFRTRRRLHAVVGAHLEAEAGDSPEEMAPILSLHFLRAGDHARAWRYARMAGDGARDRFAYVDAAAHYRRAIDAARGLSVARTDLAGVWEALGEARAHTGDLAGATEAFTAARGLVHDDPVREAHLLHRHALVSLDAGRVRPAVRWAMRALRALDGVEGRPAAACRAHLVSTLATVRQRQGRRADAIRLCHRAIEEAEAAGNDAALAHSCYVLDWALVESGRPAEATHSARALEIYTRLGDLDRQAAIYNNLGGFAYFEGRWADAVALYLRGAEASIRAGDAANAAFGDCNVGEVLADQGHLADAEARLRRALRVWRATGYEWGVAFSTALLGRVAVRDGRDADALELLDDALTRFRMLRVDGDAAFVEALLAEAWVFGGHAELALDTADRLREEAAGGGRAGALLDRVRAFALAQRGDLGGAVAALQSSIASARARGDDYELAVGLDALEALARSVGAGDAARRRERDEILARLDVVALPPAPVDAQAIA
jgi:tetratricopeptide (TPR) repeat protein